MISVPSSLDIKEHLNVDEGIELHRELSVEDTWDVFIKEKVGLILQTNQLTIKPNNPYMM